jgi:TRAP transporter TAXI family solute receptor
MAETRQLRALLVRGVRRGVRSRTVRLATVLVLLVAAGLGWWLGMPQGVPYPKGTFGLATGSKGGVYERYGQLLQPKVDHDLPGVLLRLDASVGGPDNLAKVSDGRDAFGIATADAVAHFPAAQAAHLRSLGRLYDDYVQLIVPSGSSIRTVADLRGKRVGTGQHGSGVALIAQRVLQVSGLDPAKDLTALPLGIDEAPEQLIDGKIDAFFWSGGLPSQGITTLTAAARVRLVALGGLADAMDVLAAEQDPGARNAHLHGAGRRLPRHRSGRRGVHHRGRQHHGDQGRRTGGAGPAGDRVDHRQPGRDRQGGALGPAGGHPLSDLHRPVAAGRGRPPLLRLGQALKPTRPDGLGSHSARAGFSSVRPAGCRAAAR